MLLPDATTTASDTKQRNTTESNSATITLVLETGAVLAEFVNMM